MMIDTEMVEDDNHETINRYDEFVQSLSAGARDWLRKQQAPAPDSPVEPRTIPERLDRIESLLTSLVEREQVKGFYSVEEFARVVGKAEFTCREWCRLGRIKATKKNSGRGKHQGWAISHEELLRYRKEGLLPQPR
jgi:hypothetical protein